MALGHEDDAVGRHDHVVRLIEVVGVGGAARLAERQQQLAVGTELEHLMALRRTRQRSRAALRRAASASVALTAASASPARRKRRVVLTVGHPHVALAVDEDAVREDQHPVAEALHELAARIELEHCGQIRHLTARAIETTVLLTAFGDPDRFAVLVDLDGARRSPRAAFRKLEVAFNRLIRVGQLVGRLHLGLRRNPHGRRPERRGRHRRREHQPFRSTCNYHRSHLSEYQARMILRTRTESLYSRRLRRTRMTKGILITIALALAPAVAFAQTPKAATYITDEEVKAVNATPGADRTIRVVDIGNENFAVGIIHRVATGGGRGTGAGAGGGAARGGANAAAGGRRQPRGAGGGGARARAAGARSPPRATAFTRRR